MKVLFAFFFILSLTSLNHLWAGTISSRVSVKSQKSKVREELMQTAQSTLGKKEKIYQRGDISFYASISEFKEKLPEMPEGIPVIIYGEVYKGNKVIGHPQIITLLGHEATFSAQSADGEFYEIKIVPLKLTH